MAPHRSNRKGDLGNYRPESSAADIDNIFFTEEGWVYRHFKGDPRDPNTRFWDEIIVAGQVDLEDTENGDPLETLSATPRHYLGLGAIDESNSTDGYDADGIGYATADIPFEEVFLPTGDTRVIGTTDKIFDVEYPKPSDSGDGGDGGGGGCNVDDDCPDGYVCEGGVCVPAEIPIIIDEVNVSALDADGTNPDVNDTHEYIFSITGNADDAVGIMRIEPTSAGTVVDNTVKWTSDGTAKVIFDVTSATAEDSPQSGELAVNVTPSAPLDNWVGYPATEANIWSSVAYGNGRFVAVAKNGTNRLMTSTDGKVWEAKAVELNTWNSVTYGNGKFVAVSNNGTNRVMTSTDGEVWVPQEEQAGGSWRAVTYGDGKFVAVSSDGRAMTSPDGENWTRQDAFNEGNDYYSVTYGNGKFVAISWSGDNRVMTSPDGVNWTAHADPGEADGWQSVTYGNGKFVAVGYGDININLVMTSPDGENWTGHAATETNTSWNSVTYGNGKFVAVSDHGTNRVMTSTDGENWTAHPSAEQNSWQSVTYGDGKFVAVSNNGTNRVMVLE